MKTKKWYAAFGMILFIASSVIAQNNAFEDDIFFSRRNAGTGTSTTPVQQQVEPVRRQTPVVVEATVPSDRDVDEYNRRYINDSEYLDEAVDSTDTTYVDGQLTQRIVRFQDPSKVVISGTDNVNISYDGENYQLDFNDPSSAGLVININNTWSPDWGWGWNSWSAWNSPWRFGFGWNSWSPGFGFGWNTWSPWWGWGWNTWSPGWGWDWGWGWNSWSPGWGPGWGWGWNRPGWGWNRPGSGWVTGGNRGSYNSNQFARNTTRDNHAGGTRSGVVSRENIVSSRPAGSAGRQSVTREQTTTGSTTRSTVTRGGLSSAPNQSGNVSTQSRTRVSSSPSPSSGSRTQSSGSGVYNSAPRSSGSSSGSYSSPSPSRSSSSSSGSFSSGGGGGSSQSSGGGGGGGGGGRSSGGGGGRR